MSSWNVSRHLPTEQARWPSRTALGRTAVLLIALKSILLNYPEPRKTYGMGSLSTELLFTAFSAPINILLLGSRRPQNRLWLFTKSGWLLHPLHHPSRGLDWHIPPPKSRAGGRFPIRRINKFQVEIFLGFTFFYVASFNEGWHSDRIHNMGVFSTHDIPISVVRMAIQKKFHDPSTHSNMICRLTENILKKKLKNHWRDSPFF